MSHTLAPLALAVSAIAVVALLALVFNYYEQQRVAKEARLTQARHLARIRELRSSYALRDPSSSRPQNHL